MARYKALELTAEIAQERLKGLDEAVTCALHGRPVILGLDISTSITGYSCVDTNGDITEFRAGVNLTMFKDLWKKSDIMRSALQDLKLALGKKGCSVEKIVIEEPVIGFRPGKSSARTIARLVMFNGMVSLIAREIFGLDPMHIISSSARSKAGIKIKKGERAKAQVLRWVGEKFSIVWPLTKTGKPKPWCEDVADATVLAIAGTKI